MRVVPSSTPPSAPSAHLRAVPHPHALPAGAQAYLARSATSLHDAVTADGPGRRYSCAHVSALQAAAALLATRAHPDPRRRPQRNAWVLLTEVAPELAEWAAFFSAGAAKRAAAESGARRAVTEREADDLVRDADLFLATVETSLGLVPHVLGQPHAAAAGLGIRPSA